MLAGLRDMSCPHWQRIWMECRWLSSQDEAQRWFIYNTLIFSSPPRKVGLEATDSNKVRRAGTGVLQTDCKGSHREGAH